MRLLGGTTKRCEVYPDKLCKSMLVGLRNQVKMDGMIRAEYVGAVCSEKASHPDPHENNEEEEAFRKHYEGAIFIDDLSGHGLDREGVIAARREELAAMKRLLIYEIVDIEECWAKTNMKPISTKWVDIDKRGAR